MEKLGEQVPATTKFNIGYFEGKQSKRHWIYCQEDIDAMYQFFKPGSEVSFGAMLKMKMMIQVNHEKGGTNKQNETKRNKRWMTFFWS